MNQRPSAYPTIEAATDAAMAPARRDRRAIAVVADQPHDGGFALVDATCVDLDAVYIMVDENGNPGEGKAALTLPIGFSGALPITNADAQQ